MKPEAGCYKQFHREAVLENSQLRVRNQQLEAENAALRAELATRNTDLAEQCVDSLRLIETVKYLRGIAERGSGDRCPEDMSVEQFVLGYVKNLERRIEQQNSELAKAKELLCVIHRDGGQYLNEHGFAKAVSDAEEICHRWKSLDDELAEARKDAEVHDG